MLKIQQDCYIPAGIS